MALINQKWGDTVLISRNQLSDISYKDILRQIFITYEYENYLEIGTNVGNSMRFAKNHCIGVDPNFIVKQDIITDKKTLSLYQTPSDDFFEQYAPKIYGESKIDLAFIDGLHVSDQVIRDFHNVMRYSYDKTVVLLHDVIPRTYETSLKNRTTRFWTGDVWRACQVIMDAYTNMNFVYINCPPSGLLMVWHKNGTMQSPENIDCKSLENQAMNLQDREVSHFLESINYCESSQILSYFEQKVDFSKLLNLYQEIIMKKFRVRQADLTN